jgi:hypothetical protein
MTYKELAAIYGISKTKASVVCEKTAAILLKKAFERLNA